uniref:sulfhydryl oxidase 2-like n=1 Tax=Myxine glutinosa TaxID=7769 RepID=UPI00358DF3C9
MASSRVAKPRTALLLVIVAVLSVWCFPRPCGASLYHTDDMIVILEPSSMSETLRNSTGMWMVVFYAAWCGHCIDFAPTWKSVALDVKDWRPLVNLAAMDCADRANRQICQEYRVKQYPSIRYFKPMTSMSSNGEEYTGTSRSRVVFRHTIVDHVTDDLAKEGLLNPLSFEPLIDLDIEDFFAHHPERYLALVFEESGSYVGREVMLDLMHYQGIVVRRSIGTDTALTRRFNVLSLPTVLVVHRNGSSFHLQTHLQNRVMYTYALRQKFGVERSIDFVTVNTVFPNTTTPPLLDFDSSVVYMADLESALYYSLSVEVASHSVLSGNSLRALKRYVTILAKLFPGRLPVKRTLQMLSDSFQKQPRREVPYEDIQDVLSNSVKIPNVYFPEGVKFVGCQGSQPNLRGYPCSLWILFHTLTVRAASHHDALVALGEDDLSDMRDVLLAMHAYVSEFFGCHDCAVHFKQMAKSLFAVRSWDSAVLWLWRSHNKVNLRIAGSKSEDPQFPKIQWPPPDICQACHIQHGGEHQWNTSAVLNFLKHLYREENISPQHLPVLPTEVESEVGRERRAGRSNAYAATHLRLWRRRRQERDLNVAKMSGEGDVKVGGSRWISVIGIGFSRLDLSLCMVLYLLSVVSLCLMYLFVHKRICRRRMKPPCLAA